MIGIKSKTRVQGLVASMLAQIEMQHFEVQSEDKQKKMMLEDVSNSSHELYFLLSSISTLCMRPIA